MGKVFIYSLSGSKNLFTEAKIVQPKKKMKSLSVTIIAIPTTSVEIYDVVR